MALRHLYLHGFASGPKSAKAVAFANHFGARGMPVESLDLRVPTFEHQRLSAMIETTQAAIGGPEDRAIVFGSSLGGLTAARTAEKDPRVEALVLLAPAFQIAQRWRELPDFADWKRTGWREVYDFTTKFPARVDYGFFEDAAAIDVGFPDVRVPTLILHGVHDDSVPIEASREFAAGRANVTLIELDDDHQLTSSIPRLLAEAERFLAAR